MIHNDTIELLKECNAGIKMGIDSIDDVLDNVEDENFKNLLSDSKRKHEELGNETHTLLNQYEDSGKEPNPMAKTMSKLKTTFMMSFNETDNTVADLITDGCNMGVKSLNKYLNKYKAAEEQAKDIAKRLINIEEKLAINIRQYL